MCWGVPAIVVDIDNNNFIAKVDYGDGVIREAIIGISSNRISKGDIVIIHAGVIISKIDYTSINEYIELFKEILGDNAKQITDIFRAIFSTTNMTKGVEGDEK